MLLPSLTYAEVNTINTFSPYSMYGLGELQTQGTQMTRSMGGAGVAVRNRFAVNLLNPASYSIAIRRGVLFNFSAEGAIHMSAQKIAGEMETGSYMTANFHDVALQIPLAKGLGMGISVAPYSSVGYKQESDAFLTDNGDYGKYVYSGNGDVTQVKLGVGWAIWNRLSIGIAAQYYWGDLDRTYTTYISSILTPGASVYPVGTETTSVSSIKGQVGVQWTAIATPKQALIVGATFDSGGDLNPRYSKYVSGDDEIYAQADTTSTSIVLPRQLSLGVSYNNDKISFAADYSFQKWGNYNDKVEMAGTDMAVAYNNVNQLRVGIEYIPRRIDIRKYFNRVAYRAGFNMGGYQYSFAGEEIGQYNITAGLGFPINLVGVSKIDVGVEWGSLGSQREVTYSGKSYNLVRQNTFKFSLGFSLFGDDYWFQRPQID